MVTAATRQTNWRITGTLQVNDWSAVGAVVKPQSIQSTRITSKLSVESSAKTKRSLDALEASSATF